MKAAALALVLLLGVPAAASAQPARDTTAARPTARDTTARRAGRGVVPADSLPSGDARTVLKSIPEPLGVNEEVEADSSERFVPEPIRPDTSAADTAGVPTPEPTAPLGERPGGARNVFADSAGAASPPPASAPVARPPAASSPVAPTAPADTCWRVQIAAPDDRTEAEARRAAAESQLLVPIVIETEQGRHKVRSKSCLSRAAADALKARALDSGFAGTFLIRMTASGQVVPVVPPARRPAAAPARKSTGTRR